jgi:hypothetical protein
MTRLKLAATRVLLRDRRLPSACIAHIGGVLRCWYRIWILFDFPLFHLIHHGFHIFRIRSIWRQPLLLSAWKILQVLMLLSGIKVVLHVVLVVDITFELRLVFFKFLMCKGILSLRSIYRLFLGYDIFVWILLG